MCSNCEISNIKHVTIDINKKNLLIINLPEDMEPEVAKELLGTLEERITNWMAQPAQPVFVLTHFDNIQIRLEKVENG